jgi:hypothetical protein
LYEIWVAVIGALVAAVGATLGGLYLARWQAGRREAYYTVESTSLSPFDERGGKPGPLTITVDKSLLTDSDADAGQREPVENAYVTRVFVKNIGNRTIENLALRLVLDEAAHILKTYGGPSLGAGYRMEGDIDDDYPNRADFRLPYLNAGDAFLVNALSVCDGRKKPVAYPKARDTRFYSSEEHWDRERRRSMRLSYSVVFFNLGLMTYSLIRLIQAVLITPPSP